MAFGSSNPSTSLEEVLNVTTEAQIASYYLGIKSIPARINSPLRRDNHPSMGIYSPNGVEVNYIDFANKEGGRIFKLLALMWGCSLNETYFKILQDFTKCSTNTECSIKMNTINVDYKKNPCGNYSGIILQCKIREFKDYDIKYWNSYGISLEWLKFANVYPISHKIIIKNNQIYVFGSDRYAYVFVENKENKTTLKIYQPFNKSGYKWSNSHDKSVISLWTKLPNKGDKVTICSSVKDALCLWANTGIPAIAIQGEGYPISTTAVNELKKRFNNVYIMLDNDEVGLKDAEKLSESTGFTNLVLPQFDGGKDISDLYKVKGKHYFLETIKTLYEL